jgi:hypothetical protein
MLPMGAGSVVADNWTRPPSLSRRCRNSRLRLRHSVALLHGGRHVDRANHSSGPAVRSDDLYPAKRECSCRGITDIGKYSENSLTGTLSPEGIREERTRMARANRALHDESNRSRSE